MNWRRKGEAQKPEHHRIEGEASAHDRVDEVEILVAVHANGGEGIYAENLPGIGLYPFLTEKPERKAEMEALLKARNTVQEVKQMAGATLEWRKYRRIDDGAS